MLPGCHQPGQWPLISWKPALRSGGGNRWGQGVQAEQRRGGCWQGWSCPGAHGGPLVGADEGHVRGCHPRNDSRTSWVRITKSCHIRAWSSQQSCKAAGFVPILQMRKPRARNDIIRLRRPRGSRNQAVRVRIHFATCTSPRVPAEVWSRSRCSPGLLPGGVWRAQAYMARSSLGPALWVGSSACRSPRQERGAEFKGRDGNGARWAEVAEWGIRLDSIRLVKNK